MRAPVPRWKSYGVALVVGLVGAVVGAGIDSVTVQLSPDYFVLGKGLSPSQLPAAAWALGLRAGGPVGVGVGLLWVFVLERRPQPWAPALVRWGAVTLGAVLVSTVAFGLGPVIDPMGLEPQVVGLLGAERTEAFLLVWRTHLGAYVGGGVGALGGTLGLWVSPRPPRRSSASAVLAD